MKVAYLITAVVNFNLWIASLMVLAKFGETEWQIVMAFALATAALLLAVYYFEEYWKMVKEELK